MIECVCVFVCVCVCVCVCVRVEMGGRGERKAGRKERHRKGKRDLGTSESYQESRNMNVQ